MAMIKEAKKRARDCIWVAEVDWRDELGRPTDEVRSRMKLSPSIIYSNKNMGTVKKLSQKAIKSGKLPLKQRSLHQ